MAGLKTLQRVAAACMRACMRDACKPAGPPAAAPAAPCCPAWPCVRRVRALSPALTEPTWVSPKPSESQSMSCFAPCSAVSWARASSRCWRCCRAGSLQRRQGGGQGRSISRQARVAARLWHSLWPPVRRPASGGGSGGGGRRQSAGPRPPPHRAAPCCCCSRHEDLQGGGRGEGERAAPSTASWPAAPWRGGTPTAGAAVQQVAAWQPSQGSWCRAARRCWGVLVCRLQGPSYRASGSLHSSLQPGSPVLRQCPPLPAHPAETACPLRSLRPSPAQSHSYQAALQRVPRCSRPSSQTLPPWPPPSQPAPGRQPAAPPAAARGRQQPAWRTKAPLG